MAGQPADPLILGRYRRIETLGQGASGTVELCWDMRIQRRVAIKCMHIGQADHPGDVPGLQEARTGAMLSHPSIVSVIDFETRGDMAFLIMEALEGPSLAQLIEDTPKGTFDLDILTSISTAIANALDFAHENQVLHLDIKPDNILVTLNGTTKVSDFGISELAGARGFGEAVGGTIGYMPPEQMEGATLDERCDEFALAMVIYEMLTGDNPYRKKSLEASDRAIHRGEVTAPSLLRGDIDPGLDDVLFAALAPNRDERYPSIGAFFNALLPYLGDAEEGIAKLRDVVAPHDEILPEDEDAQPAQIALLDHIGPRARTFLGRILCTALCWLLAFLGLGTLPTFDITTAALIALAAPVAAVIRPAFGALLGIGIFGITLICNTDLHPALGIAVIVAVALWFASMGRQQLLAHSSAADINCALLVAPLAAVHLAALVPFVTGLCLPAQRTTLSSIMSGLLALALYCACGIGAIPTPGIGIEQPDGFANALSNPATWIIVVGWIASAVSMSLLCSRGTRVSSLLGSVITALLLLAALVVAQWAQTGMWGTPSIWTALSICIAMALTIISIMCGASRREEGED